MAAESLDIKTLTTLLMATPKTDVVQSVGRILRTKHAQPIVIDIVDKHELFQRQWAKRKTYYHKQKYTIIKTTSKGYEENLWETLEKGKKKDNNTPLIGKCLIKI